MEVDPHWGSLMILSLEWLLQQLRSLGLTGMFTANGSSQQHRGAIVPRPKHHSCPCLALKNLFNIFVECWWRSIALNMIKIGLLVQGTPDIHKAVCPNFGVFTPPLGLPSGVCCILISAFCRLPFLQYGFVHQYLHACNPSQPALQQFVYLSAFLGHSLAICEDRAMYPVRDSTPSATESPQSNKCSERNQITNGLSISTFQVICGGML